MALELIVPPSMALELCQLGTVEVTQYLGGCGNEITSAYVVSMDFDEFFFTYKNVRVRVK